MNRQNRSALFRWAGLGLAAAVAVLACGRTSFEDDDFFDLDAGVGGSGATGVGGNGVGGAGIGGSGIGGAGIGGAGIGGTGVGGTGIGGSGASGGGSPGCGPCAGCCDATGVCRSGSDSNACGLGGVECLNCGALGFACVSGACEGPAPACSPATCTGCCDAQGQCQFGDKADACGVSGGKCANCAAQSQSCIGGKCQGPPPACGPKTCGGCCDAQGTCQTGTGNSACGNTGSPCENCVAGGKICNQPGSYCAFFPSCGSVTCPTGCCDKSGKCLDGKTNAACGSGGSQCANCASQGQSCAPQGFCYSGNHCGPDNCAGCCTATGQCVTGATGVACGQYGKLCDNCLSKGQSCVAQVCSSGSTCPAAYSGCSPSANTLPPVPAKACPSADIALVAQGCSGGGPGCGIAFETLLKKNPSCYNCMLQFGGEDAYTRCLAPYLNATCNHDLTCAVQCGNTSCDQCSPAAQDACETKVFGQGGACRPWVNGYFCAEAALSGPGAFCEWNGNFGSWLKSVGTHYCAAP